jgi:hypothetical protein
MAELSGIRISTLNTQRHNLGRYSTLPPLTASTLCSTCSGHVDSATYPICITANVTNLEREEQNHGTDPLARCGRRVLLLVSLGISQAG